MILDFCNLYSDVHNPISFSFSHCKNLSTNECIGENQPTVKLWSADKAQDFCKNIDTSAVDAIQLDLEEMSVCVNNVCKTSVTTITTKICNVFHKAASDTFGNYNMGCNKFSGKKSNNKPWFNKECRKARKNFHLAKKNHNNCKSEENLSHLKSQSKNYKRVMDECIKNYRKSITEKIKNVRTTNTKEYWKILNSTCKDKKCAVDINDYFNFIKGISETEDESLAVDNDDYFLNVAYENVDDFLNCEIDDGEILAAVKNLKNNKAAGFDRVLNEHICSTITVFLPVYKKLFNVIFDSGIVPDEWLIGIVKPIYKNKGDPTKPENYRPITLLSCLGKLFTSILSTRLEAYANEINIISESQTGFRKGYSTLDHALTLQFLSETLMKQKKKLFCAFIDFKQAFDTIWRSGLWYKMSKNGISGKCYVYIKNMYQGIKSLISMDGTTSDFINCNVGVRQGENLSPFLFSLYIIDLENFLFNRQKH